MFRQLVLEDKIHLAQLLVLADFTAKVFMQQDGAILVEIVRRLL
jgi:hypothetical protein